MAVPLPPSAPPVLPVQPWRAAPSCLLDHPRVSAATSAGVTPATATLIYYDRYTYCTYCPTYTMCATTHPRHHHKILPVCVPTGITGMWALICTVVVYIPLGRNMQGHASFYVLAFQYNSHVPYCLISRRHGIKNIWLQPASHAQLLHKPTNAHVHTPVPMQSTHVLIHHSVSCTLKLWLIMECGSSWNCKLMPLCFQLIVLCNFGHGSLFMVITAGEVWFVDTSLITAALHPVRLRGFGLRVRRAAGCDVCCCFLSFVFHVCDHSVLFVQWDVGTAGWTFDWDKLNFK